jgi:predicted nucleic acid-binding protein
VALFYADASTLVKLVRAEPETAALHAFLSGADLVSCQLVLTEVPRAVRRAARSPSPPRERWMRSTSQQRSTRPPWTPSSATTNARLDPPGLRG